MENDMDAIDWYYRIVSGGLLIGTWLATAIFLYVLLKPFVEKKRAVFAGVLYFAIITILYDIPWVLPNLAAYGISMCAVFLVLIAGEPSRIRLKAFLSITAFALRWLALGSVQQIMLFVSGIGSRIYDGSNILAMNIDFLVEQVLQLALTVLFLGISVHFFLRVYRNVSDELPAKEFVMLVLPMSAQVVGYQSVVNYYALYDKAMTAGVVDPVYEVNVTLLLFYLISYIAILAFLTFYQEIKEKRENHREQELLASQVENLKEHITTVERAYEEIRGMRHDLINHLITLDGLMENGDQMAARAYAKKLEQNISHTRSEVKSGNPVTNVILQEYMDKFAAKKIAFTSDFHYPVSGRLDSFDLSIVLFNALQNAYEATGEVQDSWVTVRSYRTNNAYIVEVCNNCVKKIHRDALTGLPVSGKEHADAHGYGLKNIRRIVQKYNGDIRIDTEEGRFRLSIMVMLQ